MISLVENRDALVNLGNIINELESVDSLIRYLDSPGSTSRRIKILYSGGDGAGAGETVEVSSVSLQALLLYKKKELTVYLAGLGINVDY